MSQRQSPNRNPASILKVKVSKIQTDNVPIVGWRTGRFFVDVKVDDGTEKTEIAIADSGWVLWDDEFHFDTSRTSRITFTLRAVHRVRMDTVVGWSQDQINASLWNSSSIARHLRNESGTLKTRIHFRMELLPRDAACAAQRQAAYHARAKSSAVHDLMAGIQISMGVCLCPAYPPGAERHARHTTWADDVHASTISAAEILGLDAIDPLSETWEFLLKHVEIFTNIIHPFVKFACSVLTMAQTVALAQKDRDERFRQLIKTISEVFCFLNELKMAALEGHRQTIKLLALQTTECAYFIRDYTKQKSFIIRAATNTISGAALQGKIGQYERKFQELKVAFRDGAALNTEITVVRIAEKVDRIATAGELNDLPYAPGARFDLGKQCLPGTRAALLDKIYEWVNKGDAETPRVLFISGDAGSGKSAIAHTVSSRFNELKRLGSSFFFARGHHDRGPDKLFSTVTRDLADLDSEWKEALKQVIGLRAVRKTSSVLEQFEEFILKPTRRSLYFGPVVIVIDALDAAGEPSARQALVSLLSSRSTELPSNFRILVTTRPEPDICNAFKRCADVAWWDMLHVVDKQSNLHDISAFFASELSGLDGWSDRACRKLTAKSKGEFGWAASACASVKEIGAAQSAPERISALISHPMVVPFSEELEDHSEDDNALSFLREKLHLPCFGSSSHERSSAHNSMFTHFLHPHTASKHPDLQDGGPSFPVPVFYPPSNGLGIAGVGEDAHYPGPTDAYNHC
ncbi:hypothetical protein FB451DRAFT_1392641 [Mycena latifolia]|nr:hypothetical protein FB451DRAFT_1392641 [Mycena latifolia]